MRFLSPVFLLACSVFAIVGMAGKSGSSTTAWIMITVPSSINPQINVSELEHNAYN
jgi:hypothetical protein